MLGPYSLSGPNVGNSHRSNAALLMGSAWNQHDDSMLGQCVSKGRFHVIPLLAVKSFLYYISLIIIYLEDDHCASCTTMLLPLRTA